MSHLPSALHYYLSVPYVAIIATIPIPWVLQIRKLPTSDCCTRDPLSCRLFPLTPLFGLFRCRFSSATRLPQCYNMSAYLPGLHAARPSAFVEGAGVEPAAHPKRSGNHRMRYGVREHSPYSMPVCPIVSGFFLPCMVANPSPP